eukprot:TRINITY_DN8521_c0_g2_i16.p1 TRINITY_DN8521_c0_g2~~TRINITY_DN8521_c0_g2_i16.p1  ORF type:complete len:145 (+),score=15.87 TRINITY_DN8521_c0_g2_i16:29-436(+)
MIRRPPRSTRKESSAASDVYKRQEFSKIYGCCKSKPTTLIINTGCAYLVALPYCAIPSPSEPLLPLLPPILTSAPTFLNLESVLGGLRWCMMRMYSWPLQLKWRESSDNVKNTQRFTLISRIQVFLKLIDLAILC